MIAQNDVTTLDPEPVHAAVTRAVLSGNMKRAEALSRWAQHIEIENWKKVRGRDRLDSYDKVYCECKNAADSQKEGEEQDGRNERDHSRDESGHSRGGRYSGVRVSRCRGRTRWDGRSSGLRDSELRPAPTAVLPRRTPFVVAVCITALDRAGMVANLEL